MAKRTAKKMIFNPICLISLQVSHSVAPVVHHAVAAPLVSHAVHAPVLSHAVASPLAYSGAYSHGYAHAGLPAYAHAGVPAYASHAYASPYGLGHGLIH